MRSFPAEDQNYIAKGYKPIHSVKNEGYADVDYERDAWVDWAGEM